MNHTLNRSGQWVRLGLACLALTAVASLAGCQNPASTAHDAVSGEMGLPAEAPPPDKAEAQRAAWKKQKAKYLDASRREHNHHFKAWKQVESWNFDDGKMPEDFHIFKGKWDIHHGQLRAYDGPDGGNRIISISHCKWPAFRVSFDVQLDARKGNQPDQVGDIGIRLNADPKTASFAKGYVAILAQYFNQSTVLYRLNIPWARTEYPAIVPGKLHHVSLEVVKPHIRVWVDGHVVLEAWSRHGTSPRDTSDFLDMDPTKLLVLHTYDTNMFIDNLKISVPDTQHAGH